MPASSDGGGGGGTKVVVEAAELRRLAGTARRVQSDVDGVTRAVGGLMSGLDRRGWNAGAADAQWSAARGRLSRLGTNLSDQAKGLDWLAGMVDYFETGRVSGGVPYGLPLQDPVNSLTGNLAHLEIDLALPARGRLPLAFARTYNSRDRRTGLFGPGWTSSIELHVAAVGDDAVIVLRGDGRRDLYQLEQCGYVTPFGVRTDLSRLASGGWQLNEPDGRWARFSTDGDLERVGDNNANGLSLERDRRGRVVRLVDDVGRALSFKYDADGHLREVYDPAGRSVCYAYSNAGVLESVTDVTGQTTRYTYSHGRLACITDPLGNTSIANSYDEDGRVLEQVDPMGGVSTFDYAGGPTEPVTTLTDPRGSSVTIVHDERGLVRSVVDVLGGRIDCTFTECGNRASLRDQDGRLFTYEYDGQCRLARIEDPDGGLQSLSYDAVGNVVAHSDALGNTWRFDYDERRNMVASIDPEGGRTDFEVDAHGQVVGVVDADGVTTRYDYDEAGQLTGVRTADAEWRVEYDAAGRPVRRIDVDGAIAHAQFDAANRPVRVVDAAGAASESAYDAAGNLIRHIAADGAETLFEVDAAGRVVRETNAAGSTTTYSYDANGNQTSTTDAAGCTVRFAYDELDRPAEMIDALGGVWRKRYDAAGRVTTITDARGGTWHATLDAAGRPTRLVDRTGATRSWVYDSAGRLTSATDPNGTTSTFDYDRAGRATARVDGLGRRTELGYTPAGRLSSIVDAIGRRVSLTYDAAGRLHEIVDPLGGSQRFEYDRAGRVRSRTDRSGERIGFDYDASGHLVAETDALGDRVRYEYDGFGRLTGVTDGRGFSTTFDYDRLGHVTAVVDPLGLATRYRYDDRGFLVEHEDARGHVRRFGYDANGWLTSTTDGLGRIVAYTLDPNGNWVERVDPDGTVSRAAYDAENRLLSVSSSDGTVLRLEYDANGRAVRTLDALGATQFDYNALGQPERVVDPFGREVRATYDAAGRRVGLRAFDGRDITYSFDALDRLIDVTDWRGARHRYAYDVGPLPIGLELASGAGWRATRDALGRVLEIEHVDAAGMSVAAFTYAYDAAGNVASVRERHDQQTDDIGYQHDALGRLIEVRSSAALVKMEYDEVGNRRALRTASYDEEATFDAADQLVSLAVDGREPVMLTYDDRGNLLSDGSAAYTWDAAGRLTGVRTPQADIEHRYDGQGRLYETRRTDASGQTRSTRYARDLTSDPNAVLAANESFSVYGLGPLSSDVGDRQRSLVTDALGSVRRVLDDGGAPSAWRDYDAWGASTQDAVTEPFGFTGAIEEPSVGLVYLGARWYQPQRGRWLGRDPVPGVLLQPRTQHPYAYAHDDPVSLVDPSGMSASSAAPPFGPFAPPFGMPPAQGAPVGPVGQPLPWWEWWSFPNDPISAAVGYSTAWPGRRVADIDNLFKGATKSFTEATKQFERSAAAYTRAMRPSRVPLLRLPLLRDARRGWFTGSGRVAMDRAEHAMQAGRQLDDAARAMEGATPWVRPVARVAPVVSVAADFGFSVHDQWQADAGESTGTKVRHAAIQGVATAGGAYVGGAALAAGCTATGVGAIAAAGCAAVGGWVGGKVGGVVGKGTNWAVDKIADIDMPDIDVPFL